MFVGNRCLGRPDKPSCHFQGCALGLITAATKGIELSCDHCFPVPHLRIRSLSHACPRGRNQKATASGSSKGLLGRALRLKAHKASGLHPEDFTIMDICTELFTFSPTLRSGEKASLSLGCPDRSTCSYMHAYFAEPPSTPKLRDTQDRRRCVPCCVESPKAWGLHHYLDEKPGEAGSGQNRVIVHFEWSGSECIRVQLSARVKEEIPGLWH